MGLVPPPSNYIGPKTPDAGDRFFNYTMTGLLICLSPALLLLLPFWLIGFLVAWLAGGKPK